MSFHMWLRPTVSNMNVSASSGTAAKIGECNIFSQLATSSFQSWSNRSAGKEMIGKHNLLFAVFYCETSTRCVGFETIHISNHEDFVPGLSIFFWYFCTLLEHFIFWKLFTFACLYFLLIALEKHRANSSLSLALFAACSCSCSSLLPPACRTVPVLQIVSQWTANIQNDNKYAEIEDSVIKTKQNNKTKKSKGDFLPLAVFSYIYVMVPHHLVMGWFIVVYSATPTTSRDIFLCIAPFRFDHFATSGISQCLQFYRSSKRWNMTKSWFRKVHKKEKMHNATGCFAYFSVLLRCRSVASFWSWVLVLSSLWLINSLAHGALIWAIICFNYWLISCPTPHQTRLYCAWVI